jgi:hypothetical protein
MSTRILAATFLASALFSPLASADWASGAGVEHYSWEETLQSPPLSPKESGSRYALHLKWMENGDSGLLYAYSAKLYTGRVDYDTYTQFSYAPVSTQTDYNGMTHEGQLIARHNLGDYQLDYVGGLGWDSWRRTINMNQIEDYSIWFLRTGVSLDQPRQGTGFHGSGGLKLPIRTSEDAHLDSAGYDSNPQLSPGKRFSLYAELAYRPGRSWDIVGYYDSWRFSQSDAVTATSGGSLYSIVQPQSSMNTFGLKAMYSF